MGPFSSTATSRTEGGGNNRNASTSSGAGAGVGAGSDPDAPNKPSDLSDPNDPNDPEAEAHAKGKDASKAGATATVAMITTSGYLVVANVGDSAAVLCCDEHGKAEELTVEHTPKLASEAQRIVELGGFVSKGATPRVMGEIAVSRSIGASGDKGRGSVRWLGSGGWSGVSEGVGGR